MDWLQTDRAGANAPPFGTIDIRLLSAINRATAGASAPPYAEPLAELAPPYTQTAALLAALNAGLSQTNDPFLNPTAAARAASSTHGSMPDLDPGPPDTIEAPRPPEEPVAMSDDEDPSDHEDDVFVSRETPGDFQMFRKMALLCGEVLSVLTSNESIMIVNNSMSDANVFKEQHKLNNYQRDTLYNLLCITSACRLGREPNLDRFARFAVWLQNARLLIDSRERFDGNTEAQRAYDRHLVDLDHECNTRRVLGGA